MASTFLEEKHGWTLFSHNKTNIWFKGYLNNCSIDALIEEINKLILNNTANATNLSNIVKKNNGHFAIVIDANTWLFGAVDKIRSIPLYYTGSSSEDFSISNYTQLLKDRSKIDISKLDSRGVVQISMSGYCIGRRTMIEGLYQLNAGECIFVDGSKLTRKYYYTYSPWLVNNARNKNKLIKEFSEICWSTIQDIVKSAEGRQIVIPLSAGNDSRLIASGLKEMGIKNVLCFSYGKSGNFESVTARAIADKLGYPWINIPVSIKSQKLFFESDVYRQYIDEFESYASVPAVQDVSEIYLLFKNNIIDKDAVIINGNSGDFISGGHVINKLNNENSAITMKGVYFNHFLDKHFSLWECLRNTSNDTMIVSELNKHSIERNIPIDLPKDKIFGITECLEYAGRQTQYVVNQQRAYDYFGYDWRLPLWSDNFLNFWEGVPLEYKLGQTLYIESLYQNNWGKVWKDIPVNKKKISPAWLGAFRLLMKPCFIPFGKDQWHKFDKKVFQYWIDPSYNIAITSYYDVLNDKKGYRNHVSWVVDDYFKHRNIKFPGN